MAVSPDVLTAIRELTNAKQLDRAELFGLLQDGIQAALQKKYGPTVQAEVDIDDATGSIRVVMLKTVVQEPEDLAREISLDEARLEDEEFQVGDIYEREIPFTEFGRAAVQAAKQRIVQRVREGERTRIKDEFSTKVGELLSGEVQQIERGKIVLMLNRFREAEAIIPTASRTTASTPTRARRSGGAQARRGHAQGPRLILSRADALFVQALFRSRCPRSSRASSRSAPRREVGSRTKIAVFSRDDAIDPVGACVGLKGARVQAVVNELGGERIDIVPWSADPERFAKLALAPAKVARVFSEAATRTIQVVVDDDQLSLAIGRNGQNVRLASELTGWKLDLFSSREWVEKDGAAESSAPEGMPEDGGDVALADINGIDEAVAAVLEAGGYRTLNDIIDLDRDDFLRLPGIAPAEADHLMSIIDSLTTEDSDEGQEGESGDAPPPAS
jgi:N utilization substance protein A